MNNAAQPPSAKRKFHCSPTAWHVYGRSLFSYLEDYKWGLLPLIFSIIISTSMENTISQAQKLRSAERQGTPKSPATIDSTNHGGVTNNVPAGDFYAGGFNFGMGDREWKTTIGSVS